MDIFSIIFFIVFSTVAVSYGWGMRGTIIGGEKGAMLPGAFMGLLMAFFSGSEVLASSPWILAGVGALGMYCGGNMTYGDTLHLTMCEENPPHFAKNMFGGIFLRGGIWFGIFGGYVSMFISAISGFYHLWQILAFFCMLPLYAFSFYLLLNKPFDPSENKFPKFYFSIKRKETWGGLLGMLIEIIVMSVIFKDWSTVAMTGGAFLSGAVGWTIAQLLQIRARLPGKKGKRLFERLNQKNKVSAWKIMECFLGAFGGMGCAITFILAKPLFGDKLAVIDTNGFYSYISDSKITYLLFVIYLFILAVDCIQYFIIPKETDGYKKYMRICNQTEFAVYCIIPLLLSMIGSHLVSATIAFPVIILVLCQEFAEKSNKVGKTNPLYKLMYILPVAAITVLIALIKDGFNVAITLLMYTVLYEAGFFIMKKIAQGKIKLSNSEKTVHGYFITCCILIIIMTIFI